MFLIKQKKIITYINMLSKIILIEITRDIKKHVFDILSGY